MNKSDFSLKENKYIDDNLTSIRASIDFLIEERFIYYDNSYIYQDMLKWLKEYHSELII